MKSLSSTVERATKQNEQFMKDQLPTPVVDPDEEPKWKKDVVGGTTIWSGEGSNGKGMLVDNKIAKALEFDENPPPEPESDNAVVYRGDALSIVRSLLDDIFQLLYTNPPFAITQAK